jgi:enolase
MQGSECTCGRHCASGASKGVRAASRARRERGRDNGVAEDVARVSEIVRQAVKLTSGRVHLTLDSVNPMF